MIHIIHHSDTDGYGAAYAAWSIYGASAKYYPVNYGMEFPVKKISPEDEIYVLDFSFLKDILDSVQAQCKKLLVIDHHKTAHEQLSGSNYLIYDVAKSGCVLAWEYFTRSPVPQSLLHIQDWDLWQFKLPNTKAIHTFFEVHKDNFMVWKINDDDMTVPIQQGTAMLAFGDHAVKCFTEKAWKAVTKGYKCVYSNAPYPFISETCHKLLEEHPDCEIAFSVSVGEHAVSYSLRSREDGPDVGEIAKEWGGGGHKHAAGFRVEHGAKCESEAPDASN